MQQQSFNALSFAFLVLGTLTETGCASRDVPKSIEVYSVVSAEGDFRAGAAAVDITPDGDGWLAGFDPERRATVFTILSTRGRSSFSVAS